MHHHTTVQSQLKHEEDVETSEHLSAYKEAINANDWTACASDNRLNLPLLIGEIKHGI